MTPNQEKATSYLSMIRGIEKDLHSMRIELDALTYKAGGMSAIRYDKDHVKTSPSNNYMDMIVEDMIALEKKIAKGEKNIEKKKGKAYAIVRRIESPEHRAFIEWYYFNGLSMIETAAKMNVAERTSYYLRDDALEEFGKLL